MKTKILVIVVVILSVSYLSVVGQNSIQTTNDKDHGLDLVSDPKLTQDDIDLLIEASRGAPVNAEPVKDDRLPSDEIITEGVYSLAPANAEPIDYEAEQKREREQLSSKPAEVQTDASKSVVITQELPEKSVEVTNYRNFSGPKEQPPGEQPTVPNTGYPKGSSEQPPGEKVPE
jgi:hypothetical protein